MKNLHLLNIEMQILFNVLMIWDMKKENLFMTFIKQNKNTDTQIITKSPLIKLFIKLIGVPNIE